MLLAQEYVPDLSEYKDRFMRTPLGLLTQGNVSGAVDRLGADAQGRVEAMSNPEVALQTGFDFMGGGLLGVVKNPATQSSAKSIFGTTLNPKETGYILDDGTRLDFSGRHYAGGYEKQGDRFVPTKDDYLANQRSVDHREVGSELPGYDYGWEGLSKFIDETGAVRYDPVGGISLMDTNKPSKKQIEVIVNDYKRSGNPLYIDIDNKSGANIASKEFNNPTINEVFDWINSQYK
jgi:hypothetical protein